MSFAENFPVLMPGSDQYNGVKEYFKTSIMAHKKSVSSDEYVTKLLFIEKIQRVPKNKQAYGRYKARQMAGKLKTNLDSDLKVEDGTFAPGEDDKVENEVYLFHGTRLDNVENICRDGFAITGERGSMFGRGIYFSAHSSKCDAYTDRDKDGLRCLIVARAALGRMQQQLVPCPTVTEPPQHFHSICGESKQKGGILDCREYVLFGADQVFPEFLVWYRHLEGCPCGKCAPIDLLGLRDEAASESTKPELSEIDRAENDSQSIQHEITSSSARVVPGNDSTFGDALIREQKV